MKLQGKVAIVTGGARGNGFAAAKCLAGEGADIVLTDICANIGTVPYDLSTKETLDGAVAEIQKMGAKPWASSVMSAWPPRWRPWSSRSWTPSGRSISW